MNGQRLELAHGILILIGFGLFVAGIATRLYGASTIGIVVVGANLHALAEDKA
jgi:hypothetical protein